MVKFSSEFREKVVLEYLTGEYLKGNHPILKNKERDLALQIVFAKELGLKMSKFDGSPVDYIRGGELILEMKNVITSY